MKQLSKSLICLPGLWLFALTVSAQVVPPDSIVATGSSTLFKTRPMTLLFGALNLAVEQTVGKRSSLELEATQSVGNGRFVRVFGNVRGLSASFRYYPLANQAAPQGLYAGAKVGYSRLRNSDLLRLITFFTSAGDVSLWSAQGMVGYQYCSRRNLVLDAQGGVSFLNRLTYREGALSGQPNTERRATVGRAIPSLALSVGYRFQHRRY